MNNELIMILAAVFAFLYVQLIMRFTFGWFSMEKVSGKSLSSQTATTFSVLVAVRNEESTIFNCLLAIGFQYYPSAFYELVIINDHSTDNTVDEVKRFISNFPGLSIRLIDANGEGKKSAIAQGINASSGELILVTDADCIMSQGWIKSFAGAYEKSGARCISGPVKMVGEGVFGSSQVLEFMSLIGVGAGSISARMPVMCNGANLCYERAAYEAVGGFGGNDQYASGDDIFLMLKISKRYGSGSLIFLKDPKAIVTTSAQPNLQSFLKQRMRWTSKSPGYKDFGILLTAISVMLISLGLLLGFGYGLLSGHWQPFLLMAISKLIIDLPLLISVAAFMHQKRLLFWYLPVQIMLPFYITFAAIGGVFSTVLWKGRPVK
jgi:biofilm PGA synthesis N-glycosyltransferase PgaC